MKSKNKAFLLLLLAISLLASCSSTSYMLDAKTLRSDLDVGQALTQASLTEVTISYPEVYYDGVDWYAALVETLEKAQSYIILETFLGSECDQNQKVFDILARKASEGVKVYFVNDGVGFFDMTESKEYLRPFYYLEDVGVKILTVNPVSGNRLIGLTHMLYRDHRKMVVVDGLYVALGGMNLNYVSMNAHENGGQRDSMYLFKSPSLAERLMKDFVDFWNDHDWRLVSEADFPPWQISCPEASITAYLANQYGKSRTIIAKAYGILLSHAQKKVEFLPYLPYMDNSMVKAIANAAQNAEVKILVPFDSRRAPRVAAQYAFLDLMETGATVYRENANDNSNGLLHEKLMIVDGQYSVVGSMNYNFRSMTLSDEIALIIDSKDLASQLGDHFDSLLEDGRPLTAEEAQSYKTLEGALRFAMVIIGG